MSNSLLVTVKALRRQLDSARALRQFAEARARRDAFSRHATLVALLAALQASRDYAEKERIVRALIAEHRTRPSDLWSAALTVAFYPMLVRLRARLCEGVFDRGDLDQLVLGSFLEALLEVPIDPDADRVPLRLAGLTRRQVMATLVADRRERKGWQRIADEAAHLEEPDLAPADAPELDGDDPDDEAADFLAWAERTVGPDRLELIVSLHLEQVKLPAVIARRYPDADPTERQNLRMRLKRQRSRAMERLRTCVPRADEPSDEPTCAEWLRSRTASR